MNASKNKILIWSVILLVIANVAILISIWQTQGHQKKEKGSPADFLIKELSLNKEQEEKLHVLAKAHHEESQKIKEDIKAARHEFFKLLKEENTTDSSKIWAVKNVSKNLERLDLLTFTHFKEVRKICTPKQQEKFDGIIEEVLQMIAAPPLPREGDRLPPPEH